MMGPWLAHSRRALPLYVAGIGSHRFPPPVCPPVPRKGGSFMSIGNLVRFASPLLLAGLLPATVHAQGTLYSWYGDTAYDGLGRAVAALGDVNGDGYADVFSGAPLDGFLAQDAGAARVFSGFDGSIITTQYDPAGKQADEFGYAVAGLDDVNGDGVPDYVVGSPRWDTPSNGAGKIVVYSGAAHAILWEANGASNKDFLGWSVDNAGDVNNDGFGDIIAGAWEYDPGINPGPGKGYARVYNGLTGAVIHEWTGDADLDFFGHDVAGIGDINGDNHDDLAVGLYGKDNAGNNSGMIRVFSGIDGSILADIDGLSGNMKFGISVSAAGDVNNDGTPDILVGGDGANLNGNNSGSAHVLSGANFSFLYTWYGDDAGDLLGKRLSGIGDVNGDNHDDVAVAMRGDDLNGANSGAVRVFSGIDGTEIFTVYGDTDNEVLGWDVGGGTDINNDGVPDFVAGASQYNNGPGPGNGLTRAYDPTGTPPPPPPTWPELPTSFMSIGSGYSEGFESYAGVVPSHMAVNELNSLTRTYDSEAWCNIGQNGPLTGGNSGVVPRTGTYGLEMGLSPFTSLNSTRSNGLIIGLDGTGAGTLEMSLWVYDHGEESNNDDGIFLSENGTDWVAVYTDWQGLPDGVWTELTAIDLSSAGVNTDGPFYLGICQQDNFSLGAGDGVSIDDVEIAPVASGPTLTSTGTCGGAMTFIVENATPSGNVAFVYAFGTGSLVVPNGFPCAGTQLGLDNSATLAATLPADAAGTASLGANVPAGACGNVFMQCLDLSTCEVTNVLTVQ
ncbi:MAG: hypothetical protein DWQ01_02485 [Planctomycetota bacterium]|nr:MAG: hypothetical protein DWQ01_02485 [Planctomycetota bacterium]